ncbi:MAG: hypothetical protein ABI579_00520 [Candidatus Sumerlaeota bacterium]
MKNLKPHFGHHGAVILAAILALSSSAALAVPIVNIADDGSGDFFTISAAALAAVDDGGEIRIIKTGTYAGNVTLVSGKSYTIKATVPGVIYGSGSSAWTVSASGGPPSNLNVTLDGFEIRRSTGTGQAMTINQSATFTQTLTLTNMIIRHTGTVIGTDGGEALKFDIGVTGGAAVNLIATTSVFQSNLGATGGKSAIRVQGNGAGGNFDNLTVNLTNCLINCFSEGAIRLDSAVTTVPGLTGNTWTLTGCTINSGIDRGFEVDDPTTSCTFNFTDTTITNTGTGSASEAILANDPGDNNTWNVRRCTFDNQFSTTQGTVRIDYNNGTSGTNNAVSIYNSVFKFNAAGATNAVRAIDLDFVGTGTAPVAALHHNTFVGIGTPTASRGISAANSGAYELSNNLFLNVPDPWAGTTGTKTNNYTIGPTDETSGGTYLAATDLSDAISSGKGNLDATTYVPFTTPSLSPVINAGDLAIATVVGNVDRNNATRPAGAGANPDVGAFEVSEPAAAVADWLSIGE